MNKKIVCFLVCALLVTNFLVITNAKEENLIKQKIESIVFSEPIILEEEQYLTINLPETTSYLMKPGKPALPVYTKIFKFPFKTKIKAIECKPLALDQKVISGKIKPVPHAVVLNNIEQKNIGIDFLVKDSRVYGSKDFYPDKWFDYKVGCGLDDSDHVIFLAIQFYPIRYSPAENIIQYANKVDIKIEYFVPTEPVFYQEEYDMVLITPAEFSENLQPLVDYKKDCSVNTKLVTLDEIYNGNYFPVEGRDDQEKIKYFIKNAFEQWNITHVLLAGGANKIPVRMSYVPDDYETSIISDLYYADLFDANGDFCSWDSNGNSIFGEYNYQGRTDFVDLYPDVLLGRLNFREPNEVSNVVNKIITYESTGAYMQQWFSNIVVCGGDTFYDFETVDEGEYLNQNAIDMMDGFNPEKIWVTNGKLQFAINIDNAISNGTGFLYMTGHGTHEAWATHPHNDFQTWWPIGTYFYLRVEILNNAEKLPVVIIGGCSNCEFSGMNCFGWSFVKNPNGGGIASYGNSALGYGYTGYACSQGLTGAMELSAFDAYAIQNAKTTGELWVKALNNYLNQFWFEYFASYKTVEEWQPFNDPSMHIAKVSDKPNKPIKPVGPIYGEIGRQYNYTTSSIDPDDDQLKYCYDWGDGTVTWTQRFGSGENTSIGHNWEKPGNYQIKVKARDVYGLDSEWSEPLLVNIMSEAPYFDILKISGGFTRVKTVIKNIGSLDAYEVNCSISVNGGIFGLINVLYEENLESILIDEEKTVVANKIFGFGKINVTVTASSIYANIATKTASGFVFGPVVFIQQ